MLRVGVLNSLPMVSLTPIRRFSSFALPELYNSNKIIRVKYMINLYAMQKDKQRPNASTRRWTKCFQNYSQKKFKQYGKPFGEF
jgi:hypothetical protein